MQAISCRALRIRKALRWPLLRGGLAGALFAGSVHAASFKGVGDLPGGNFQSIGQAISPDGGFVVGGGNSNSTSGTQAWRWNSATGAIQGLGDLPGGLFNSWAYGVSTNGSVVVGSSMATTGTRAFSWSAATGVMTNLGDLAGGSDFSIARAVSANGAVVVGQSYSSPNPDFSEAFRQVSGTMTGLGEFAGGDFFSTASAVSADGSIVAGISESATGLELMRWIQGAGLQNLGGLTGGFAVFTQANGISGNGAVIVGNAVSFIGNRAFRRTDTLGIALLGVLPGDTYSFAIAASFDGSVIVGNSGNVATQRAFLWTAAQGMRNLQSVLATDYGLNLTGWVLTDAVAVSSDGRRIVGNGTNPTGQEEAWWAELSNPPPTIRVKKRHVTTRARFKLKGSAADDVRVARVEFARGKKKAYRRARGTTKWRAPLKLKSGRNIVFVRGIDNLGEISKPRKTRVIRR